MQGMDTKTMIHAGVEIVIIGGIAFYFNKRIGALEQGIGNAVENARRIKELEDTIASQQDIIAKHEQVINYFASMLNRLPQSMFSQNPPTSQTLQPQTSLPSQSFPQSQSFPPTSQTQSQQTQSSSQTQSSQVSQTQSDEQEYDESDEIIARELEEAKKPLPKVSQTQASQVSNVPTPPKVDKKNVLLKKKRVQGKKQPQHITLDMMVDDESEDSLESQSDLEELTVKKNVIVKKKPKKQLKKKILNQTPVTSV